ncbi:hypothetical protein RD110_15670 [Rhodoferax koreense]|uniref:Uncharacterized protein n=1 Tax=Rhodoferax koreensis TaxID=1842727 RepID=A0A1P8JXP0_9BURK|nr:hypothetical protein [Rhodoferax koreense]APW38461.1 hypothetical protein RD110_15670 [Rhodoferax koreense]
MRRKQEIHLQPGNFGRSVEVRVITRNADGDVDFEALPLTFEKFEPNQEWRAPVLEMDRDAAQSLMDELWRMGYRPERGHVTASQIAATEKHLDDMRAIVSKLVKVELPT